MIRRTLYTLLFAALVVVVVLGETSPPADAQTAPCAALINIPAERLNECAGPWAQVIVCESSGIRSAANHNDPPGGSSLGYLQFKQATWDGIAREVGWLDLVGVDPRNADLPTTLAMGDQLKRAYGLGQWPTCGRLYLHGAAPAVDTTPALEPEPVFEILIPPHSQPVRGASCACI